jgi:foldase protein PrsA
MVNGKPITRLSLIRQLEKTSGRTALESLINDTLIEQEAKKANVVVTDSEIQAELEKVKKDLEAQGMNLDTALSTQGMSMNDFQENLRMKQTVEKILKDDIQVSDEDVKKYFEENKELFGEGAKFEDLEQSIKDQLRSEKLSVEFQTWYSKLKEESDIKYFLSL